MGTCQYLPATFKARISPASVEGMRIWTEKLNSVVILTQNYRYGDDKQLEAMLNRLQVGEPSGADIRAFNTRRIGSVTVMPGREDQDVIVVPRNIDRERINNIVFRQACAGIPRFETWRERGCLRVEARMRYNYNSEGQAWQAGSRLPGVENLHELNISK
jgi:hypothetical protein